MREIKNINENMISKMQNNFLSFFKEAKNAPGIARAAIIITGIMWKKL